MYDYALINILEHIRTSLEGYTGNRARDCLQGREQKLGDGRLAFHPFMLFQYYTMCIG
jgi:hypothetical protein